MTNHVSHDRSLRNLHFTGFDLPRGSCTVTSELLYTFHVVTWQAYSFSKKAV